MNINNKIDIMNLMFDELPYFYWKDINGIYLGANSNQIRHLGLKNIDQFVGKTIFDVLEDIESAKLIHDIDLKIMQDKIPMVLEETIKLRSGEVRTYLSQKIPLIEDNQVIGLLGFASDITKYLTDKQQMIVELLEEQFKFRRLIGTLINSVKSYQLDFINESLNIKDVVERKIDQVQLTNIQEQVLFLLVLGKSIQQITDIINELSGKKLSTNTINQIINAQLFSIFEVKSIDQLIEVITALNIIVDIPESMREMKRKINGNESVFFIRNV